MQLELKDYKFLKQEILCAKDFYVNTSVSEILRALGEHWQIAGFRIPKIGEMFITDSLSTRAIQCYSKLEYPRLILKKKITMENALAWFTEISQSTVKNSFTSISLIYTSRNPAYWAAEVTEEIADEKRPYEGVFKTYTGQGIIRDSAIFELYKEYMENCDE